MQLNCKIITKPCSTVCYSSVIESDMETTALLKISESNKTFGKTPKFGSESSIMSKSLSTVISKSQIIHLKSLMLSVSTSNTAKW